MSINRVAISGNLTRDPEVKPTKSGNVIMSLSVAVNDRRKNNQTGQWEDYPNFIDCTMFGDRAQKLSQYLSKGTKVAIAGKLSYRSWQAQDGSKRSKVEVVIDDLEFMSKGGNTPSAAPSAPSAPMAAPAPAAALYDENIPF